MWEGGREKERGNVGGREERGNVGGREGGRRRGVMWEGGREGGVHSDLHAEVLAYKCTQPTQEATLHHLLQHTNISTSHPVDQ